ncbi:osmoprotectant NAGGN system M42 family peptidase, partial [Pseudomonas sp. SIMBA_068]
IRTALVAFGCDATHGYERTHVDSLAALSRLLSAYLLSPPVFASDSQPANASLERFSHQLEHDAQMESDTRVPAVDSLVGNKG